MDIKVGWQGRLARQYSRNLTNKKSSGQSSPGFLMVEAVSGIQQKIVVEAVPSNRKRSSPGRKKKLTNLPEIKSSKNPIQARLNQL